MLSLAAGAASLIADRTSLSLPRNSSGAADMYSSTSFAAFPMAGCGLEIILTVFREKPALEAPIETYRTEMLKPLFTIAEVAENETIEPTRDTSVAEGAAREAGAAPAEPAGGPDAEAAGGG